MQNLDEEERMVLDTPVESIPPKLVFKPVPLAARMTEGKDSVKKLIKRQREMVTKQAADSFK